MRRPSPHQLDMALDGGKRLGLHWTREPVHCGRATYHLFDDERPVLAVVWCGHPTALRPYSVASYSESMQANAWSSVEQAKAAAERYHRTGSLYAPPDTCTRRRTVARSS